MIITSTDNDKVKKYCKLSKKKYRDLFNQYIVEGEHLVLEAYKAGCLEEVILLDGETIDLNVNCVFVSYDVMKKITSLDTPCKIIGLCNKFNSNSILGNKILLLDDIQDPGNLGTIIRSALAFNIDTIVLSENTVDLYNTKVLRSTQGMIFHINIVVGNLKDAIKFIKNEGITVYGTNVVDGIDVRKLNKDLKNKYAIVMGNEGNGVKSEISSLCDKNIYINMNNNVESLNVAIATSIILYEMGKSDE